MKRPGVVPARSSNKVTGFTGRALPLLLALVVASITASCRPPAAERDPGPEDDIESAGNSEQGDSAGSERQVSLRADYGGEAPAILAEKVSEI